MNPVREMLDEGWKRSELSRVIGHRYITSDVTERIVRMQYVLEQIGIERFEEDMAAIIEGYMPARFVGLRGQICYCKALHAVVDGQGRDATADERWEIEKCLHHIEGLRRVRG